MSQSRCVNEGWQARVKALLIEGFGTEDIAVITGMPLETVQAEVKILRETGDLIGILNKRRASETRGTISIPAALLALAPPTGRYWEICIPKGPR